jgi:hypothetical protein
MDRSNWIHTSNPFSLRTPPDWFLARLAAYDSELRIFASIKEPVYRMGRVGRNGHGLLNVLNGVPDTAIYVAHRCWPWKSVLPESLGMQWARVLAELPDYDTQRFADPGETLDEAEAKIERELDARIADEADQRAADMYRTMGVIDGFRVGSGKRHEGAGYRKTGNTKTRAPRRRDLRPSFDGPGGVWTGR